MGGGEGREEGSRKDHEESGAAGRPRTDIPTGRPEAMRASPVYSTCMSTAMIWTQVPSRSLAWEAKRLTLPGGLVRLRRLTDRGRWSSGISFFLLAYRPHRKLLLGRGTFGVTGAWSSLALQPQRLLDRSTALGGDRSRCGDFARGAEHLGIPNKALS